MGTKEDGTLGKERRGANTGKFPSYLHEPKKGYGKKL